LDARPDAGREEIQHALAGNICRCTGYIQILDSVEKARGLMPKGGKECLI
jgi:aerobic-type carbon monoxide dehydrogenase small subunit (CoxS/CutS family)